MFLEFTWTVEPMNHYTIPTRVKMIDAALMGCGGMMPLPKRYLTSLMLRLNGRFLVIDCGEGTQVTMKSLGWGFKNIDVIAFTHFHADHIAGLPGLLLTMGNSGRSEPLTLVGPAGLEMVVKCLTVIAGELPFKLQFVEMEESSSMEISGFHIKSLKVEHRITCFAYSVEVMRQGKFNAEKALASGLPKAYWSKLQNNESVEFEGETFSPALVMGGQRQGIKITYCTDSRPVERLVNFAKNSDLFICEGIYGEDDKIPKAKEYKHMVFSEAATLAKQADAKELWLTHYSPSLTEPELFLENATHIFPNTQLGFDRKTTTLQFKD